MRWHLPLIVRLPNAATTFQRVDPQHRSAANHPFATIEPNVGVVGVPMIGWRLQMQLRATVPPRSLSISPASWGASRWVGQCFSPLQLEADAICQVTRVFTDEDVTMWTAASPGSDIDTIRTELILAAPQTLGSPG